MQYLMLAFYAMYASSSTSIIKASKPVKQLPIVSENILFQWGYKSINLNKYPKRYCNSTTLGQGLIRYQSIKAIRPLKNSHTYPRYNLVVETYSSIKQKNERLKELKSRQGVDSKTSKSCFLRKIGSKGNSVYILHTDAALFSYRIMTSLMKRWKKLKNIR